MNTQTPETTSNQKRRSFLKLCYGASLALLGRSTATAASDVSTSPPKPAKDIEPVAIPQLFSLPENVVTRWASPENPNGRKGAGGMTGEGRKGRPNVSIKRGEQLVLAEASGSNGIVRRIWMTSKDQFASVMRGLRLDIYWDGAATPAVSAPMGDFFGQGIGKRQAFESAFFSNPEGRSFNCVLPMPFQTGFRIVMTNEAPVDIRSLFYDVNYTLGDRIESSSYLHAHWRRENPTTLARDYTVLPAIAGRGRYLGANFSVIVDRRAYLDSWWGEGEAKIFLDGDDEFPSLVGTGTEDYLGSAWGQGKYANVNQGSPFSDLARGQYAFYRYHVPDPIYFSQDIRVVFQQIGGTYGSVIHQLRDKGTIVTRAGAPIDANIPEKQFTIFDRQDDWASCCYFYLNRPENGLPPLAPVQERVLGLPIDTPPATPTNAG